MPRLSDSMQEGTILKWLIADGGPVARGDELVDIETDKATVTHAAEAEGTLEILAPEGATLPVGALIARLGEPVAQRPADAPAADAPAADAAVVEPTPAAPGAAGAYPPARAPLAPPSNGAGRAPATVHATPLARRAAHIHQVELARLAGSGPRGRITRADVLVAAGAEVLPARSALPRATPSHASASASGAGAAETGASQPGVEGAKGETRWVEPSRVQQLIARRMAEAKATIPHFQVQTEARMDAAIELRSGLKASVQAAAVPSLNDFVIKACAIALRGHPRANGSYSDGGFELHGRINVGVAVAADDALLVPVIKDADAKSLGAIARESRRLAERVRAGEVSPPELSGATFTVSNLGMAGMTAITAVVSPGQAAILGVGALRETLARVDGEIVDRTLMTLTLSCDHRILYGADAARLLSDVRALLEAPLGLLL